MGISFPGCLGAQMGLEMVTGIVGSTDPPIAAREWTRVFALRTMSALVPLQMLTPVETRSTGSAILVHECTSERLLAASNLKFQWLQTTLSAFTLNIKTIDVVMAVGSTIASLTEPPGCTFLLSKQGSMRYEFLFRSLESFRFHHEVIFVLRMRKVDVLGARWADHVIAVERHRGGGEAVAESFGIAVWSCVIRELLMLAVFIWRQL